MNNRGFTLLELIIVIAIIGIMTSVTLVYLGDSRKDRELEVAAREVAAAVREAQNNALTGKNASSTCNSYVFTYGGSNYSVSNNSGCSNPPIQYTLKNKVTFQNSGSFSFSIPFGVLSPNNNTVITLQNQTSTTIKTINVCVYPPGRVEEKRIGEGC
ncbi:MAG: prepilin-type N-terminal cleavage/methylation domain-containing protein [Candidatus Moranbacteria bacterium]|nr:prepilin-type N-terminal cleavage/methylation domain-containing protein [Candidatus Moranbacteria bacterium]